VSIWQETKGIECLVPIDIKIKRMVESQYRNSTRGLVNSLREQDILENELEKSKPSCPLSNSKGKLHWLLFTPFRYPPLNEGGRFHTRVEQSIFYGSIELETAMAEIAYKRFVFRACSEAFISPSSIEYTAFEANIKTDKGVDLTASPFSQYTSQISDKLSHSKSQILGKEMRGDGVEAFLFFSARHKNSVNCGVFCVESFAKNNVSDSEMQGWVVYDSADSVEFRRGISMTSKETKIFHLHDFLVKNSLPIFS
jgi:hypothetical protein